MTDVPPPSATFRRDAIRIRNLELPRDRTGLLSIDTSVTETERLQLRIDGYTVSFRREPLVPPVEKRFPLEPELAGEGTEERAWAPRFVAEMDPVRQPRIVGFLALRCEQWNRRAAICHLYVDRDHRGQGIGSALIQTARGYAHAHEYRCLWLEVTNVNLPAIDFYERCGFRFCGFDLSLYDPAGEAAGEVPLFFALPIDPRASAGSDPDR